MIPEFSIAIGLLVPIIYLGISLLRRKEIDARPMDAWILAGRAVEQPAFLSTLTASNAALANIIFLFAYWGYVYGMWAWLWGTVFWLMGLAIYWIALNFGNLNLLASQKQTAYGLNEILGHMFGSTLVLRAAAIASAATFIALLGLELGIGAGAISNVISLAAPHSAAATNAIQIHPYIFAILIGLIVAGYGYIGGFPLVVRTDTGQLCFILLGLASIIVAVFNMPQIADIGVSGLINTSFKENPIFQWSWKFVPFVFGSLFSWGVWFVCTMDSWQRTLASKGSFKSGKTQQVKSSTLVAGLILLSFVTFVGVLMGIVVKHILDKPFPPPFPVINFVEQLATLAINDTLFAIILGAVMAAFLSAIISTVDTYMIIVGQSIAGDLPSRIGSRLSTITKKTEQVRRLNIIRVTSFCVPLMAVAFYAAANVVTEQNNFTLYMIAGSIPMTLVPACLLVLFSRRITSDTVVDGGVFNNGATGVGIGIIAALIISVLLNFTLASWALETFQAKYFGMLFFVPLVTSFIAAIPVFFLMWGILKSGK